MRALRGMRPEEWVKNVLVLAPVAFAQRVGDPGDVLAAVLTAVAFCLAASAAYLLNDVRDAPLDRRHPVKRHRPVAAGELSPRAAVGAAGGLAVAAVAVAALQGVAVAGLVLGYLALAVAYTYGLKRVPVLDVAGLAGCFVLRPVAGAVAIDVPASPWLVVCATCLAGFLGFAKRRQELAGAAVAGYGGPAGAGGSSRGAAVSAGGAAVPRAGAGVSGGGVEVPRGGAVLPTGGASVPGRAPARPPSAAPVHPGDGALSPGAVTRPALAGYALGWLDRVVALTAAATLVAYVVWAAGSPGAGAAMLVTVPAVAAGLLRYAWLVYRRRTPHPVAHLVLHDPGLLLTGLAWALLALLALS